ncbi:hypothetical protein M0802_003081 [Mischocyttarus mexicanus]|nr:hypothetical protein M0802_003081 [Mischocyttarus mexicanus]
MTDNPPTQCSMPSCIVHPCMILPPRVFMHLYVHRIFTVIKVVALDTVLAYGWASSTIHHQDSGCLTIDL